MSIGSTPIFLMQALFEIIHNVKSQYPFSKNMKVSYVSILAHLQILTQYIRYENVNV